jgi:hypothetical protein
VTKRKTDRDELRSLFPEEIKTGSFVGEYFPTRHLPDLNPNSSPLEQKIDDIIGLLRLFRKSAFRIPKDFSPIVPLLDILIEMILQISFTLRQMDSKNVQHVQDTNVFSHAGLVPDPKFFQGIDSRQCRRNKEGDQVVPNASKGSIRWGYTTKDQPDIEAVMPTKLLKLKNLRLITLDPEKIIYDFDTIVEWLISLKNSSNLSLTRFLDEDRIESERVRRQINHEALLRQQRLEKEERLRKRRHNRNQAAWRKLRKM